MIINCIRCELMRAKALIAVARWSDKSAADIVDMLNAKLPGSYRVTTDNIKRLTHVDLIAGVEHWQGINRTIYRDNNVAGSPAIEIAAFMEPE